VEQGVTVDELADRLLDLVAEEDPLEASLVGIPGHDHELRDLRADDSFRERAVEIAAHAELLEPSVTRSVVIQQTAAMVDRLNARLAEHTVADFLSAPAVRLTTYLPRLVPTSEATEQAYLDRLAAIPDYLDAAAERNQEGLAAERVPVSRMVHKAVEHINRYLNADTDTFTEAPMRRALEREQLLTSAVRPAFARYRDMLVTRMAPRGRSDNQPGLCWLPDGERAYAALVRVHTTTDRTPEQLHRTGLELIEKIAGDYAEIGARVFGLSSAEDVQERLRTDPSLKWGSAEEVLSHARNTITRAEAVAPLWFSRLPSKRCVVAAVPEAEAPNAAGAYYTAPALDGSRDGTYWANTYKATERDRYGAESVAFHEAVPGHHFQIALAQELTDLHMLRRVASITAYAEGWGLYAERLADEMGLFTSDLDRLGMLAEDSMRAARLVVDTGLHAMGWTRQQTVDYLRDNTVMTEVDIQSEADRYIEDPGQALAYMVGRLEIQRVRADAEAAMGAAFDVKRFHDVVLGNGPLPMAVLEEVVAEWSGR
jgi:uncharacterized protein (DUF885 family)